MKDQKRLMLTFYWFTHIEIQPLLHLQKQILGISISLSLFLIREEENKPWILAIKIHYCQGRKFSALLLLLTRTV